MIGSFSISSTLALQIREVVLNMGLLHLILPKSIFNGIPKKPLSHVLINELSAGAATATRSATAQRQNTSAKKISTTQTAPKLCVELNDEI